MCLFSKTGKPDSNSEKQKTQTVVETYFLEDQTERLQFSIFYQWDFSVSFYHVAYKYLFSFCSILHLFSMERRKENFNHISQLFGVGIVQTPNFCY